MRERIIILKNGEGRISGSRRFWKTPPHLHTHINTNKSEREREGERGDRVGES